MPPDKQKQQKGKKTKGLMAPLKTMRIARYARTHEVTMTNGNPKG